MHLVMILRIRTDFGDNISVKKSTTICPFVQEVYGMANPMTTALVKEMSSMLPTSGLPMFRIATSASVTNIMKPSPKPETQKSA